MAQQQQDQVFGGVFEYDPEQDDDLAWLQGDDIEIPDAQAQAVLQPPVQGVMPVPNQAGEFGNGMEDEPLPFAMPPENPVAQQDILGLFQNMGEDGNLIQNEMPSAGDILGHGGPPAW